MQIPRAIKCEEGMKKISSNYSSSKQHKTWLCCYAKMQKSTLHSFVEITLDGSMYVCYGSIMDMCVQIEKIFWQSGVWAFIWFFLCQSTAAAVCLALLLGLASLYTSSMFYKKMVPTFFNSYRISSKYDFCFYYN